MHTWHEGSLMEWRREAESVVNGNDVDYSNWRRGMFTWSEMLLIKS